MSSIRRAINPSFFENQKNHKELSDGCVINVNQKTTSNRPSINTTGSITNQNSLSQILKATRKSGFINLSNRQLIECPIELFTISDNLDQDEKFWEVSPLTKIDLSYNEIINLPDLFDKYLNRTLQSFKVRDNKLINIPSTLFQCRELWHLDLGMNQLQTLENMNCDELYQLKELFLFENQLSSLPISVIRCISLQYLDVHNNVLSSLPTSFPLSDLVKLNLKHNKLSTLPSDISEMRCLEFLDISENLLVAIPDLTKLHKLSFLDATQNKVKFLPDLPINGSLDRLHIGHNQLTTIINMENLSRIQSTVTELLLHDNSISVLPSELSLFQMLRVIDITNNNISDIPASLGYNKSLQRFQIEGNPIRTIRRTLLTQSTEDLKKYLRTRGAALVNTPAVDTEYNNNSSSSSSGSGSSKSGSYVTAGTSSTQPITSAIGNSHSHSSSLNHKSASITTTNMSKIEYNEEGDVIVNDVNTLLLYRVRDISTAGILDLSKLNLTNLPISIISNNLQKRGLNLSSIVNLNLSGNQLSLVSIIESQLCLLVGLKVLDLSNNCLNMSSNVSTAATAASGAINSNILPTSIQRLILSHTNITSTDLSILLRGLTQLSELHINNNLLKKIPSEITSHSLLRELSISNNQISDINNIQFILSSQLEIIDLSSNLLSEIHSLAMCYLPSLRSINLQYNNITIIPSEFGINFPGLTYLGLYGNPQKSIRSNMISNTDAVLNFLRNKLTISESSTTTATNVMNKDMMNNSSIPVMSVANMKISSSISGQENIKSITSNIAQVHSVYTSSSISANKSISRSDISTNVHSDSKLISMNKQPTVSSTTTTSIATTAINSKEERIRLETRIKQLESELDHFSTSKSRLMEVKKELAVTRASLARLV